MQPQMAELEYPESDGKPMSDNTRQAFWIILLFSNLDARLTDFVAANLLWYPVKGNRKALAPDVMVALGRPKGDRSSYKTWEEGGVQPQIAFEIRSPSNSDEEMTGKLADYDRYGVEEYYHYDPQANVLEVFIRQGGRLTLLPVVGSFDSPLLGLRFVLRREGLIVQDATGQPFRMLNEERAHRERAEAQARQERTGREAAEERAEQERADREAAEERAEQERADREAAEAQARSEHARAEQERAEREAAEARTERLLARLRALGLEE